MARRRRGRPLDGVLLFDKPTGMSSNQALQKVRWLYSAQKAGHTGSLDPLATGMLPICFGNATKFSGHLLDSDKHYRVTALLGSRTDTLDSEGAVIATAPIPELSAERLAETVAAFIGEIDQVPPMYSALKQDGKRLYTLARAGQDVSRAARRVRIYAIRIEALTGDRFVLDVRCSKGTYIRSLVDDIAVALGTYAHVVQLHRLGVGPFEKRPMHSLEKLLEIAETAGSGGGQAALDSLLLPMDAGLAEYPLLRLEPEPAKAVRNGNPVLLSDAPTDGLVRLYDADGFIGLGQAEGGGVIAPKRLVSRPDEAN